MSILKHFNPKYDGTIPFFVGDRYYGQDIIRDFYSQLSHAGQSMAGLVGADTFLLNGGIVSQGSSVTQINITALSAIIKSQIDIPDSFSTIPPSKTTADIIIPVYLGAQTDISLSGATLDGATTNYVKASYSLTDGNTRARAKKAGSYSYEVQPKVTITVNSTVPTAYELQLATLVGNGSSTLTITNTTYSPTFTAINTDAIAEKTASAGVKVQAESGEYLKTKVIEIGDWNMDTTFAVDVAHGVADYKKIRLVAAIIRDDTDVFYTNIYSLTNPLLGGEVDGAIRGIDSTNIELLRTDGGQFDSTNYDSTSFNRGWITIIYDAS